MRKFFLLGIRIVTNGGGINPQGKIFYLDVKNKRHCQLGLGGGRWYRFLFLLEHLEFFFG